MITKATSERGPVTNGAAQDIGFCQPYSVGLTIKGTADCLFHRWNCEAVEEKAKAAKGSKAKKTDNVESYVYRNDSGHLMMPSEYLRQSTIHAAKFQQDPRSPRKSAMDLFKAGLVALQDMAPLLIDGEPISDWSYLHQCRVQVQRSGITRSRPAIIAGYTCEFLLSVLTPEYITETLLHRVIVDAGRLCGLGDFRPTYGRFSVERFERLKD